MTNRKIDKFLSKKARQKVRELFAEGRKEVLKEVEKKLTLCKLPDRPEFYGMSIEDWEGLKQKLKGGDQK